MKSSIVASLALALAAGLLWLARSGSPVARVENELAPAPFPASSTDSRAWGGQLAQPEAARDDERISAPAVFAATRALADAPQATPDVAGTGRLVLRAVDAATGSPLSSFEARLASESRFARESVRRDTGEVELVLTTDTYAIVLSSPGHEALELRARVAAGATNRLEPAQLRAGEGRVAVHVIGDFPGGRALDVQLIGTGRGPCAACDDRDGPVRAGSAEDGGRVGWNRTAPCPSCGFARERSSRRLRTASSCEFANLASGSYALRLVDDRGQAVADARELALRAGEDARVLFDLSGLRYVEIECIDVDGRSLSNVWRLRANEAEDEFDVVSFESEVRSNPLALAFRGEADVEVANAALVPPTSSGGTAIGVGHAFAGRRTGTGGSTANPRVDRVRAVGDSLWPVSAAPRFARAHVACDLDEYGVARVGPLPSCRLDLHATAEHFEGDAVVPASRATTRVALRLRTTSAESETQPELATYCAWELAGAK